MKRRRSCPAAIIIMAELYADQRQRMFDLNPSYRNLVALQDARKEALKLERAR